MSWFSLYVKLSYGALLELSLRILEELNRKHGIEDQPVVDGSGLGPARPEQTQELATILATLE